MKELCLIGATGSIGRQTLNVVERNRDKFRVQSMVARSSKEEFLAAVRKFKPKYAALVDERSGREIEKDIPDCTRFGYGEKAALDAISYGDTAVVATGGFSGLQYSLRAVQEKKNVALANKETLVCGGELFMRKAKEAKIDLTPIDSEHSALWQALDFDFDKPFRRLIITASGGPFYGKTQEELVAVTAKDALRHPTWAMGAKITIDSATLLNKGFEVIEAHHLFRAPIEKIHTLVHPESVIHSMVEFDDGGVLAQMSYPTMELPIQLALSYPTRLKGGVAPLDFEKLSALHFLPLEREKYPCYDLALCAMEEGDNYPCALNGAGEEAVKAFLQGKITFPSIATVMEKAVEKTSRVKADCYDVLLQTDERARAVAKEEISRRAK